MSQDIVADALNQIMNAKRVEKQEVEINRSSKLLVSLLEMMKKAGNIDFTEKDGRVVVKILAVNECRAVKPRYSVKVSTVEKYLKRFLPSRNFGSLVLSTNQGLMDHSAAKEKNVGGSLIAYFY